MDSWFQVFITNCQLSLSKCDVLCILWQQTVGQFQPFLRSTRRVFVKNRLFLIVSVSRERQYNNLIKCPGNRASVHIVHDNPLASAVSTWHLLCIMRNVSCGRSLSVFSGRAFIQFVQWHLCVVHSRASVLCWTNDYNLLTWMFLGIALTLAIVVCICGSYICSRNLASVYKSNFIQLDKHDFPSKGWVVRRGGLWLWWGDPLTTLNLSVW